MNLVGKIFTVFIVVMSITFAGFTSAVYVVHRNWREVAAAKDKELTKEKEVHAAEVAQRDQEILIRKEQLIRQEKTLTDLRNANQKLAKDNQANLAKIAGLEEIRRQAAATVKAVQENSTNLANRVAVLTEDKKNALAEADKNFREVVRLKDELNSANDEKERLAKSNRAVAEDYAMALEALRYLNVNHKSDYKSQKPPVLFRGHVSAVQGNEVVEIYGGSDMGLRKGHTLYVIRGAGQAEYIGRIEVLQTAYDKAVCRIIKDSLRKPMQRGDNVIAELN